MQTDSPSSPFSVTPIPVSRKFGKFDLSLIIEEALRRENIELQSGDILVISSKFAAMAEGRFVKLASVKPSRRARRLATQFDLEPSLAQLVIDESESILGGIKGFVLAVSKGILAPNAGIDRSNVPKGYAILYPKNPQKSIEKLHSKILLDLGLSRKEFNLGIVFSDSRVTPTRRGTIGIAIAVAGFDPVDDVRGSFDLFGNKLKVTILAVADEISSCAQLVMGEARESVPIALVRGCDVNFVRNEVTNRRSKLGMLIPHSDCLYIQGLKEPFRE
jgi:coenzyme F420-0:L-glutamate ligase/coenzyme F420-1:gamma-L-glutamate ligase